MAEQPMPGAGTAAVFPELIKDIEARRQKGIETYHRELEIHNGRDALLDLYEEVADALAYFKQLLMERDAGRCTDEACAPCTACSLRLAEQTQAHPCGCLACVRARQAALDAAGAIDDRVIGIRRAHPAPKEA
ncbi:MAG: hypothetical protein AB7R89_06085 [Dehalococcoidia bacterium]